MITLDAIWTAGAQAHIYRTLLAAFAQPGTVLELGAALEGRRAALGVLATLVDAATTLADPQGLLDDRQRSLLGAVGAEVAVAAFVVARGGEAPAEGLVLDRGELTAPERGATLILDCARLGAGDLRLAISGPGNATTAVLALDGLHPHWLAWRDRHCQRVPLGVDLILADATRIAALPRSAGIGIAATAPGGH